MSRFGKFIGWLITLAMIAAYDTFVIWGLATWNNPGLVGNWQTVILLAVPIFVAVNLLFMIPLAIFSFGMGKKEERKGFKIRDRAAGWFKGGEPKEEKMEQWFKDNLTEEKIGSWIKENLTEEKIAEWFKNKAGEEDI